MLTKKGLDALGDAVNFGHLIGYSPFTYSNTHLKAPSNTLTKVAFSVTISIHFVYLYFTFTKLVITSFAKSTTPLNFSQLFWLGVYSTGQFWGLTDMLLVWSKKHQTVCFFNSMVEFSKSITATPSNN